MSLNNSSLITSQGLSLLLTESGRKVEVATQIIAMIELGFLCKKRSKQRNQRPQKNEAPRNIIRTKEAIKLLAMVTVTVLN